MNWKAATDRVIVKLNPRENTTKGGLVLPDKVGGLSTGIVLAAGPQAENIKPGDTAIFSLKGTIPIEEGIVSLNADFVFALQREEA